LRIEKEKPLTQPEFDAVTALSHVRTIRSAVETLDTFIDGTLITDEEHAAMRRAARLWEQRLMASIKVRQQRSDAQMTLKEPTT